MPALHLTLFVGFAILLIAAAASDLRRFEIPNLISIVLILLYPAYAATAPGAQPWTATIVLAVAAFFLGAGLFMAGLLGGGDVKLFAATTLWVGPERFSDFLVWTAAAGGILALILLTRSGAMFIGRFQTVRTYFRTSALKRPMPYGIAISMAGIAAAAQPFLIEIAHYAKP